MISANNIMCVKVAKVLQYNFQHLKYFFPFFFGLQFILMRGGEGGYVDLDKSDPYFILGRIY
jgi:hypothetical protein